MDSLHIMLICSKKTVDDMLLHLREILEFISKSAEQTILGIPLSNTLPAKLFHETSLENDKFSFE